VILKRFFAPLWVFIFGIVLPSLLSARPDLGVRAQLPLLLRHGSGGDHPALVISARGSWS
jgi:hypothetical protein